MSLRATSTLPVPKHSTDFRPVALIPIMKCFERLVLAHLKTRDVVDAKRKNHCSATRTLNVENTGNKAGY
ncbi:hypothetical protein AALO_G00042790 [Alosa alosa]|uniref:Uncharacterized protein n=1 Tax=Alosa alosa TaxID=278164 RepID=A0AAV6HBW5_9TELE|nr:hypothetical protein AALO_G00042790 [Alosa alosa]